MSGKRKDLSLSEKIRFLDLIKTPGYSQTKAAKELSISTSQASRLCLKENAIRNEYANFGNLSRKRQRSGKDEDVDAALHLWFKEKVLQGARLDGAILKEKANEIGKEKGLENFVATHGWLGRWKKRHEIVFKKEHGEKAEADFQGANEWKNTVLPEIFATFEDRDIYNADESGLYYRGFPDRGHCEKKDSLIGGKKAKERITVLLCANMSGDDKRNLFVIGRSKKPRCFPKNSALPVEYESSANAWMTAGLFTKWVEKFDRDMRLQNRKICLLLDNCTAHKIEFSPKNIKIVFLPPNTTSIVQPMDMGCIRAWKAHYRSMLSQRIAAALDINPESSAIDIAKNVSLFDSLYLAKNAWQNVKKSTIINCFKKGLRNEQMENLDEVEKMSIPSLMSKEVFDEFVCCDDDLEIFGERTDAELLDAVGARNVGEEEEDEDFEIEYEYMSSTEKHSMLNLLRKFVQEKGLNNPSFKEIESQVYQDVLKTQKQSHIKDFFKKSQ